VGVLAAAAGVVLVVLGVWTWRRPDSFLGRAGRALRQSVAVLLGSGRRTGHALLCAVLTATLFNLVQGCCLQAVSPEPVPWTRLLWMYHLVTVIAALPLTVAGAGLREGSSMVLLAQYGFAESRAVAGAMLTLSVHLTWAAVGAGLLLRERRLRSGRPARPGIPALSVVIPTLNEAEALPETLRHVLAVPEITEVIVVDGGSSDATVETALERGCRVVRAPRGRGVQLRAGAEAARGSVLLFLHADTWLAPGAGEAVYRCLRDPLVVGGGFWKRFRGAPWWMRGSRFRCWLRLWWAGRVLGDQALFVRRDALTAVGGVPDQPLMEEIELCRRLRGVGRLALAGAPVSTSIRRFRKHGYLRTYWLMWRVSRAYRKGVPPEDLARLYEQG
jgi:rSAM/selenodomain-associated transferase 2